MRNNDGQTSRRVRMYTVWIPTEMAAWGRALCGILLPILCTAGLGIITAVSFAIATKFGFKGGPDSPMIALIGVMVAGSVVGLIAADRFFPRRWHHPQPARATRLNWVIGQPGALRRVPHRFIEYACCAGDWLAAASHPDGFPIGVAVAILPAKCKVSPLSESNGRVFEPIHIDEPIEALGPILDGLEEDKELRKWDQRFANSAARDIVIDWRIGWRKIVGYAALSGLACLLFSQLRVIILISNAAFVIAMVLRKGAGVTTGPVRWLVPGGLIVRGGVMAAKDPAVRLFTPRNASLIVDFRGQSTIFVVSNEFSDECSTIQVLPIPAKPSSCLAALAAWCSTAKPPTLEQVKTLMGAS